MVLEQRTLKSPPVSAAGRIVEDSLQALVSLGYRKPDAKAAVEKAVKDKEGQSLSVEELIRASLKYV